MAVENFQQWVLDSQNGIESLVSRQAQMPKELGEHEVLVKIHAASLNYRDLAIAKGTLGLEITPNVVPGSDGAGAVISTGKSVKSFVPEDKVVMHMIPNFPEDAFPTMTEVSSAGLGQQINGTLQEYGLFNESALVHMPKDLSFEEAATLTCSGLTAWNALYGGGKIVGKDDTILTQGTGGVSIAALQFARAAGATVIATTSSEEKASRLTSLGASHTINYKTDPSWGETAKSISPNKAGVTNVVDVGGLSTISESMKAVCVQGTVSLTGVLGSEAKEMPSLMDALWRACSVRGVILGSKNQFEDMVKFIEEKGIKPVIDEKIFRMEDVKDAYGWIDEQRHFSKVVVKIA